MKDFQMLFMGDAGIEAYNSVNNDIDNENIEILKVGHHGARGVVDSDMVSKLNPQVSLVSTGKNTFGHPNKATLDILRNTDIYRTDRNNSIEVTVNSNRFDVSTYDQKAHKYKKFKSYSAITIKDDKMP